MAVLSIVKYPDPRLRLKAEPVLDITPRVTALLNDMSDTMYEANGIGLAGTQVGSKERIIVIDLGDDEERGRVSKLYKIINPSITHKEGTLDYEEGCLSIPGIREMVTRSERVIVSALDEKGEKIELDANGLLSICLQHEIDHLDGILFIDHLSRVKREILKSKLAKLQK